MQPNYRHCGLPTLKWLGALYLVIQFNLTVVAQKPIVLHADSLLQRIAQMKDDTNKVNAYFADQNAELFYSDKAPAICAAARNLAKKLNFANGVVQADVRLLYWYMDHADYVQALAVSRRGLALAKTSAPKFVPDMLSNIGEAYRGLNDYPQAIDYHLQALKIYTRYGWKKDIVREYALTAVNYAEWNNFKQAFIYDKKAELLAEQLNDNSLKVIVYSNLGWHYYLTKNYLAAYRYCRMDLAIEGEDNPDAGAVLGTLGNIYRDAPDSLLLKMDITPAQRDKKALSYFKKSLAGAKQTNYLVSMASNSLDISKSYVKLGDYRQAYQNYLNYVLYRDSSANMAQQKNVMQTEARQRETALKYQQQLAAIKARQQRNYYITGIAIFMLLTVIVSRNYYTQLKLKRRSDDLLHNILPADVAEELKQTGQAQARQFDQVTVLFTDFVKFTTVSELLSPQELVDELNQCFKAFDHIVTALGIEKIKTIGDAYLAVTGLPNADADHAAKTVKAAIAIQSFMQQRKLALGDKTFGIRIGIHSGSVVAGIVGVKKFAYDIWGDTVNTAARMEQNSEPGKINISQTTRDLLTDEFTITYRGELEAKNKGLLKMYFVS
ncbi:tetratricopeptide repeat protein [Inquilinus sp. KBS0705]|nr:tetratricopeptide repeat protein [Inquilinus sp. KBS0705]